MNRRQARAVALIQAGALLEAQIHDGGWEWMDKLPDRDRLKIEAHMRHVADVLMTQGYRLDASAFRQVVLGDPA